MRNKTFHYDLTRQILLLQPNDIRAKFCEFVVFDDLWLRKFSWKIIYNYCLLKLHFTIHGLLLLDFIAIARYIFIFWLKNPAGFNDEFWSTLINLWTLLATALLQFTQIFLPGKDYPDIWIPTQNTKLSPRTTLSSWLASSFMWPFPWGSTTTSGRLMKMRLPGPPGPRFSGSPRSRLTLPLTSLRASFPLD